MRISLFILTIFICFACGSEDKKVVDILDNPLTQNKPKAQWVLSKRWINDTLESEPSEIKLKIDTAGNLDINGHKTTYEMLENDKYMHFIYVYEDTHEYYLDILHLSDTAFIYELRNCEFQTVKEKLVPYED